MCGIAGLIDLQADVRQFGQLPEAFSQALTPRGPDAAGIFLEKEVLLVHRRLVVVDPMGGKQPMQSPDGNIILIYNGELYNTEDLRQELLAKGHKFHGHSDTEVLLHAYLTWGTAAFAKLNGIFAFALWHKREKRLILCRDRLGVKPLFYAQPASTSLVFGSEIKALFCHPHLKPQLDTAGLQALLLLGPARPQGCGVFAGVTEVLPAQYVEFSMQGVQAHTYWKLTAQAHLENPAETLNHTKWLITDAAQRQLVSDVPLCTFLSGGLDSSILSMLAAKQYQAQGKTLHTWAVDYADNAKYFTESIFQPNSDDTYIGYMVDAIGSQHHKVILEQEMLCEALLPAMEARDLPGMADVDSSLLLFCGAVKEQFTVALSGECADEIFGGYPWYHREEILFADTFPWSRSVDFRLRMLRDDVVPDGADFVRTHYQSTCAQADKLEGESSKEARMREMFLLNLQWFMATLLDRKDRMSMACGLEVRVPFCDHRLVEYAYNMPWDIKSWGGQEKGIVRQAFADDLPIEITGRKKSPYPRTFHPRYTQLVQKQVARILADDNAALPTLFDRKQLEILLENPDQMAEPWYGQLMRGPQFLAYLVQVEGWMQRFAL